MKNKNTHIDHGSSFKLNKWYLDLITDKGEVFILYAANLKWTSFRVSYNSILHRNIDSTITTDWWLKGVKFPEVEDDTISFMVPSKTIEGEWRSNQEPIEEQLFNTDDGTLDWNCIQPSATVKLSYKGQTYTGRGYIENLNMTIPPWKIGMKTLRWGRFITNEDYAVWIQVHPLHQWCWYNGWIQQNVTITDDAIILPHLSKKICFETVQELESEHKIFNVVKGISHYLPGFRSVIPVSDLMANEIKWLSDGVQYMGGHKHTAAHLIHERVVFG